MPRPVAIAPADARHHLHVLGATGAGKSTLLTNLVLGDVAAGRGVVVIDLKGDLVTDLPRSTSGTVGAGGPPSAAMVCTRHCRRGTIERACVPLVPRRRPRERDG